MRWTLLWIAVLLSSAAPVHAQHEHSPYAGIETAEGTALTAEELRQLRAGEGMSLALAAELNHYPGPRHVLDMAGELSLTPEQASRIEEIRAAMLADAIPIGEELIDLERRLAATFRDGTAGVEEIRSISAQIGSLRGALRGVHLTAHVTTRAELSEAQIDRYDALRGYAH